MLLGAALFLAICTLIHPAAWWARYVPFFYTGVLLLAIFALTSGLPTARRLGMLSLIVLAGNAFLGGGQGSIRQSQSGGDTRIELDQGDGGAAEAVIILTGLHVLVNTDFVL